MSYHTGCLYRDVTEEKIRRKDLIRELTQNNKDLKQFSYISQPQGSLSNLTGLLNLIDDIPVENPELEEILNGFASQPIY
jgi:hypothetical protein